MLGFRRAKSLERLGGKDPGAGKELCHSDSHRIRAGNIEHGGCSEFCSGARIAMEPAVTGPCGGRMGMSGAPLLPLVVEIESQGLAVASDVDDGGSRGHGGGRRDWFAVLEDQQRPGVQRAAPRCLVSLQY